METKNIKLDIKDAIAKVWNKEKEKWFYLIEVEEDSPLNAFLKTEDTDDLYIASSITTAPWLWGEMIDLKTNEKIEYKLTKEKLLQELKELENADSEFAHGEADRLLVRYIGDPDIKEAYEKVPRWYA